MILLNECVVILMWLLLGYVIFGGVVLVLDWIRFGVFDGWIVVVLSLFFWVICLGLRFV